MWVLGREKHFHLRRKASENNNRKENRTFLTYVPSEF